MNGHYSLTLQVIKNERGYQFVVPVGAPYEDAHAAALELAQGVLDLQKDMIQQAEDRKLKEEVIDAKAEASE